ncbi:hypothetical protein BVG19_g2129 [[Candida] boidinii]|nr:hypothetical protein BVG19_g2129 [[Candida] boidinii]OWB51788.1 hypothetical protein B5S27_g3356 [[Candida] boidinii]OWB82255.1 hypothetical protein B5S33_g879 [[Candida] boidinii]
MSAEELGFDPSLKKKKKSKTKTESETSTPQPEEDVDELFAGLKKKKKKSTKPKEEEGSVDDLASELGELKLKKKKKSSKPVEDDFDKQLEQAGVTPETDETTTESQSSSFMPYEKLLSRFFNILRENNPELAGSASSKLKVPPPVCQREGNKKTMFANIQEIATVLQRNPEHIIQFLFAELGTSGSIDGQKRLIMRGRFQPKHIENVLRRYIGEYVICKTCKSMNTELKRESANRLHFLVCKACGSTKSVSSIKTGFQAHVGVNRRKKV